MNHEIPPDMAFIFFLNTVVPLLLGFTAGVFFVLSSENPSTTNIIISITTLVITILYILFTYEIVLTS